MKYSAAEITQADDIRRLADRLLGDQHRWRELVLLNNLTHPYIDTSITDEQSPPGVLGLGGTIYYPGVRTDSPADTGGAPPAELEAEAYGRDVQLTKDGYLILSSGTVNITTGLPNLVDALRRRLNTPRGGLPAHLREYGHNVYQYIGASPAGGTLTYINHEFEKCILEDSRVQGATVDSEWDGTRLVNSNSRITPKPPGDNRVLDQEIKL